MFLFPLGNSNTDRGKAQLYEAAAPWSRFTPSRCFTDTKTWTQHGWEETGCSRSGLEPPSKAGGWSSSWHNPKSSGEAIKGHDWWLPLPIATHLLGPWSLARIGQKEQNVVPLPRNVSAQRVLPRAVTSVSYPCSLQRFLFHILFWSLYIYHVNSFQGHRENI